MMYTWKYFQPWARHTPDHIKARCTEMEWWLPSRLFTGLKCPRCDEKLPPQLKVLSFMHSCWHCGEVSAWEVCYDMKLRKFRVRLESTEGQVKPVYNPVVLCMCQDCLDRRI